MKILKVLLEYFKKGIKDFPQIGYKYSQIEDKEIRILLFGHYRIAYLIKPNGDIDILGVFSRSSGY